MKRLFTFSIIASLIAPSAMATVTLPHSFTAGTPAMAGQVNANFNALKNAVDVLQESNFVKFSGLNNGGVDVTSTFTKLNTTSANHLFTKSNADTKIEVHVNSRFGAGTFSGTNGIQFQVRIDDLPANVVDNIGAITTSGGVDFLSMYAVFDGLTAGPHTVSIWARAAPSGSSSGVVADPGGWGGSIIVKEAR
jgi:hypothetical protein